LVFRPIPNSRREVESFQQKRLDGFLSTTLTHSPFYRSLALSRAKLKEYPIIQKKAFMSNFSDINTLGIGLEEAMNVALEAEKSRDFSSTIDGVSVGLSTGTSGTRGLFLVSDQERSAWTAMVLKRVIKPKLFKRQKVAFFLRANNNLYTSVNSSLFDFRFFDIFRPLDELVSDLGAFAPDVLAAQPSVLMELCNRQTSGELTVKLNQVISFAEVLEDDVKRKVESVFATSITEVYQCTEGFLGVTCSHGTMHINEDVIIMEKEAIDNRRFYPIITDFTRTSQPVVRYMLDDILVERLDPCPCGSAFWALESIVGRSDDTLRFLGVSGEVAMYADVICRRIALEVESFTNYQIIQENNSSLKIFLKSDEGLQQKISGAMIACIDKLLKEFGVVNVSVEVGPWAEHYQEVGGKFRRVIRLNRSSTP